MGQVINYVELTSKKKNEYDNDGDADADGDDDDDEENEWTKFENKYQKRKAGPIENIVTNDDDYNWQYF